jgi:hypothetical protein
LKYRLPTIDKGLISFRFFFDTDLVIPAADTPKRQTVIEGFVAVNELLAILIMHNEKRFEYRLFALWTFRSALERPSWIGTEVDREASLKCYVKGAAKLVEIAGSRIRRWDHEYEYGPLVGDPGSGGDLWEGKRRFCRERWAVWRRRFGELSCEVGLGGEVRGSARRAGEIMAGVEG